MSAGPASWGREYHEAGFSVGLPVGCEVVERGPDTLALRLAAADPPALAFEAAGARPSARVTVEPPEAGRLDAWVGSSLLEQAQHLVAPRLLHEGPARVAGRDGIHTVTHHLPDGFLSVTLAQWWVIAGERGVVLGVSLPTLDLAVHAPALDLLAAGLELGTAGS